VCSSCVLVVALTIFYDTWGTFEIFVFLVFIFMRTIQLFSMFLNDFHIEKHASRTTFYLKIDDRRIMMMDFDVLHAFAR
jgi:hypothetical protein